MNAQMERLAVQSVAAKIEEILDSNGFTVRGSLNPSTPTATVTLAFPEKDDMQSIIKPLIIVNFIGGSNVPIELGSTDPNRVQFIIDVFGRDDAQRDDIGYTIRQSFKNAVLTVYDFNTGFPTTYGDYTGISTKGKMLVMNTSFRNLSPDIFEVAVFPHHQEISLDIILPVDA